MGWLPQVCQTCLFDNSDYKSIRTSGAPHGARRIQLARLAPPIPHKGGGRQNRTSFWALGPPMPWDPLLVRCALARSVVPRLGHMLVRLVHGTGRPSRSCVSCSSDGSPCSSDWSFCLWVWSYISSDWSFCSSDWSSLLVGLVLLLVGLVLLLVGLVLLLVGLVFGTLKNHCFDTFVPRTPLLVGLVPMLVGLVMCSSD